MCSFIVFKVIQSLIFSSFHLFHCSGPLEPYIPHQFATEFNNRVRWHVMCFSLFPILRQYWIDVLTFTAMILTYARADAIGNSGVWWLLLDKICLNSVLFFSLFINTSLLPFFSLFTYLSFFLKFSPFFMGVKIY